MIKVIRKLCLICVLAGLVSAFSVCVMGSETNWEANGDFEKFDFGDFTDCENITVEKGCVNDKIEIADDSGNKVLRLKREAADVDKAAKLGFTYNLNQSNESGKIKVSFDFKNISYRSRFLGFGTALDKNGKETLKMFTSGENMFFTSLRGNKANIAEKTEWNTIVYIIDFSTSTYESHFEKDGVVTDECTGFIKSTDVSSLQFYIGAQNTYIPYGSSGDIEILIDNITVDNLAINVESLSIDTKSVDIKPQIGITYNVEPDGDTVTKNAISLKKGNENIDFSYELNQKNLTVTPLDYLDYFTDYTLTLSKSIKSSVLSPMSKDYTLNFKTKSIILDNESLKEGETYSQGYIPTFNEQDGIKYTYELSCNNSQFSTYTKQGLSNEGKNVLKITALDPKSNKSQEKYITFNIVLEVPPTAENVFVLGNYTVGSGLEGFYTFNDLNKDEENTSDTDGTEFRWYRSKTFNSGYSLIDGADKKRYVLTDNDIDCYIKFAVVPCSKEAPFYGTETFSEPFTAEFNPIAKNIKASRNTDNKNVLKGTYEYLDENKNDSVESASLYGWYRCDSETGDFKKIENADEAEYILSDSDDNMYLKFSVIPKNSGGGSQNKEYFSEPVAGNFAPYVSDVKLDGTLKSGYSVGAGYIFYDINGDIECNTVVEWYVNNTKVSSAKSLYISSDYEAQSIYFTVTPVSNNSPFSGQTVKSPVYYIDQSYSTPIGGGSSSIRGGVGGGSAVKKEESIPPKNNSDNTDKKDEISVFNDIKGHWAYNSIIKMIDEGVANGKTIEKFYPDDFITRGEFATMITRIYNLKGKGSTFSDVLDTDWYYPYISAVADAGYMSGDSSVFRPSDNITREEICVVINKILKITQYEENTNFEDIDSVSSWAKEAVFAAYSKGIVNGDNNFFYPQSFATRAQTAVLLDRMLEFEKGNN